MPAVFGWVNSPKEMSDGGRKCENCWSTSGVIPGDSPGNFLAKFKNTPDKKKHCKILFLAHGIFAESAAGMGRVLRNRGEFWSVGDVVVSARLKKIY